MTRTERLLRLARLRGDLAAVSILEGWREKVRNAHRHSGIQSDVLRVGATRTQWSEAEMRAAWGDR